MTLGIPIKLMHDADGHIVTCETITGEVFRGRMSETEDNMNCNMKDVTVTYRDGRVAELANIYIRGSKVRFFILPDMLKNSPCLKAYEKNKTRGGGAGRGKTGILMAQARGRAGGAPGAAAAAAAAGRGRGGAPWQAGRGR